MKQQRFPSRPSGASVRPPTQRMGYRAARWLGSLQLAVILLPTLALVLFLGTVVESRHGRPAAASLVYRTWWFVLLLGLLAVNIFFAAAKKWPWKRHQTGFIITHIGLLTLIAGGVWDSLGGTTGTMTLVSSADARVTEKAPHRSGIITDRGDNRLRVRRPQRPGTEALDDSFAPGPLPWGDDGSVDQRVDRLTAMLAWLRDPRPDGWSRSLGDDATLEVLTYAPHARLEPYGPAAEGERFTFPAVQFQLASPTRGVTPPQFVALHSGSTSQRFDRGRVDLVAEKLNAEQLAAFLKPAAEVDLHADENTRAVLQFATDVNDRLHFRSFAAGEASPLQFERSGLVEAGSDWQAIWSRTDWRFRVTKFWPRARSGLHCTPVDRPASADNPAEPPAVRLRLTHRGEKAEFWVARTDYLWTPVTVSGERFEIGYHPREYQLDFELTLLRAEQRSDPGTGKPASVSSWVLLHDPHSDIEAEPRTISLNEPLAHRGYRIYQGAVMPAGNDESGRPAHRVQFQANRDPGVWLKYAGSAMVALGIACMFYMRAYFFKRRE